MTCSRKFSNVSSCFYNILRTNVIDSRLTSVDIDRKEESSDVLARWKSRWDESRLGWHQAEPHPFLVKHGSELNIADLVGDDSCSGDTEPSRILFPLCGKVRSEDLISTTSHAPLFFYLVRGDFD